MSKLDRLKPLMRSLLPGLVLRALRRHAMGGSRYPDYDSALAACAAGAYEGDDVVRVVVAKNLALRERLRHARHPDPSAYRILAALAATAADPERTHLHVLDFGGGGGAHYTLARCALGEQAPLRWAVVETPSMARAASALGDGSLEFFDAIAPALQSLGRVDLVFTSGALHCCPHPALFLQQLLDIGARHLVITRTAFASGEETLVRVQRSHLSENGPGPLPPGFAERTVRYPNVFLPLSEAQALIRRRYRIDLLVTEEPEAYWVDRTPVPLLGLFCSRGG
jgi:putative methyltransferase (TIGR04325 family)